MPTYPYDYSDLQSLSDLKARIHALRATGQNPALREAEQLRQSIWRIRLVHHLRESMECAAALNNAQLTRQLTLQLNEHVAQLQSFERRLSGIKPVKLRQPVRLLLRNGEAVAYTTHSVNSEQQIRCAYETVKESIDADRFENLLNAFDVEVGPAITDAFDAQKHVELPFALPINSGDTEFHIL